MVGFFIPLEAETLEDLLAVLMILSSIVHSVATAHGLEVDFGADKTEALVVFRGKRCAGSALLLGIACKDQTVGVPT